MNTRQLILLSPFRLPTHNTLYLADEDVASFLNGYTVLWHPAVLQNASGPPAIASPYDHEQPVPDTVYAVPATPPPMLPDDWQHRVRDAGSVAFTVTADRAETLANLLEALRGLESGDRSQESGVRSQESGGDSSATEEGGQQKANLLGVDSTLAAPFLALGFGYMQVEALFEAMSHENLLDAAELWQQLQNAVAALGDGDNETRQRALEAAANVLLSAREVLYPSPVYLIDMLALPGTPQADPPAWPAAFRMDIPLNLVAASSTIEQIGRNHPDWLNTLRERVASELIEVCGTGYLEREDAILPIESQLWNIERGQLVLREVVGRESRVYARRRFGWHPHMPAYLKQAGISKVLLLALEDSSHSTVLPTHHAAAVSWPSADGSKQVEAFTRVPHAADTPQTYFHLAYHLYHTIMHDMSAILVFLHQGDGWWVAGGGEEADRDATEVAGSQGSDSHAHPPGYEDLLELSRLAPVLGRWSTFGEYFTDVMAGDYASPSEADEFHDDYLNERTVADSPFRSEQPVTWFAEWTRTRRKLDAAWTLSALQCSMSKPANKDDFLDRLAEAEARFEGDEGRREGEEGSGSTSAIDALLHETATRFAERLVARGQQQPGLLLLNPCSFTRRVIVDVADCPHLLPLDGPVKACQVDGTTARAVVEVPALGFAWIPRTGDPSLKPSSKRMRLADTKAVRNETFEAEIDQETGGLRGLRDHRARNNRLGQQIVFQPGSTMRATAINVTSTGPAYGEVVAEGVLVDAHENELARFRQRYQAWVGRPMLDLRIEIFPNDLPQGSAWHAYYGSRFAWRDEYAALLRGVGGVGYLTSHSRPVTPDYLELRVGQQNTVIFPGGLPFHQRHGGRMLDVLLLTPGESARCFDLGISLDRQIPLQTAQGVVSPVVAVPVEKGPPHVGATGWLCHVDAANLLLTCMRPVPNADAVTARFLETTGYDGMGEVRFIRNPARAQYENSLGEPSMELTVQQDAVHVEFTRHDLLQTRVIFSEET